MLHVEQHGPSREVFQHILGGGLVELPDCGGAVYGEGFDGQLRHQPGFFFGKEDFQNGKEAVGKRRALRELVQPIRKAVIKGIGIMMSHIAPRIMSCVKTPIPCSRKIDFGSRVLLGGFSVFQHQFWVVTQCCVLGRNIRICPLRRLLSQKRLARLRPGMSRLMPQSSRTYPFLSTLS